MTDDGRVVTAKLPTDLAAQLDELARCYRTGLRAERVVRSMELG